MVRHKGVYGFCGVLQVKGLPGHVNVRQRPFKLRSLNHGDAFIIDTGRKVYQWNGAEANEAERTRASELAKSMVEARSLPDKSFYVIESGQGNKLEKIVLELLPNTHKVFFGLFTRESKIKTAKQGGKDSKQKISKVKLYKVSINKPYTRLHYRRCKYGRIMRPNPNKRPRPNPQREQPEEQKYQRVIPCNISEANKSSPSSYSRATMLTAGSSCFESEYEVLSRPSTVILKKDDSELYSRNWLYKRDTLVMDTGIGFYLWVGKKSKVKRLGRGRRGIFEKDDNYAAEIVRTFSKKYGVPASMPWHVIHEGGEPEEFKRHFALTPCASPVV